MYVEINEDTLQIIEEWQCREDELVLVTPDHRIYVACGDPQAVRRQLLEERPVLTKETLGLFDYDISVRIT